MMTSRFELENTSRALVSTLQKVTSEIRWSSDALRLFDLLVTAYEVYNGSEEVTRAVYNHMLKVKELEKFLVLNFECHITLHNGRRPFPINKCIQLLERVLDAVQTLVPATANHPGPWPDRNWDHLTAEIQASFTEFGFCSSMEAIYDVNEATQKLNALSLKLDGIEKSASSSKMLDSNLSELHSVESDYNGIQQSMTPDNITKIQASFDQTRQRISRLESNLCDASGIAGSDVFLEYLAAQHLLKQGFVSRMFHVNSDNIIAKHMIHPGTRSWFLERFSRWIGDPIKRFFVLAGKEGSGKTALCSTVCKLYSQNLAAYYFFDNSQDNRGLSNTINGLIQGLAYEFCHTIPEYLNYLDDKVSSMDMNSMLGKDWKENYRVLLKEPLEALFGTGMSSDKRFLVVIDGLDECAESDWNDLKSFIASFVRDMSARFCLFASVRSRHFNVIIPPLNQGEKDISEGVRFEDRVWINRHIKDIEIYLSTSLGAILSGEEDTELPQHAKADVMTLQNTIDELLKTSSGRFDYAVDLMASFAQEMSTSGQFLSSMKKAVAPVRQNHRAFDDKIGAFASPYRSYRDKEGRSVDVRVMRQSHYLMDKTRVALIRGRHRVPDINQNGQ